MAINSSNESKIHLNNNFDFLRLVAAAMVLVSHSFALLLLTKNEPLHLLTGSIDLGMLGVIIFFVVSGYLITKSWQKHPSVVTYFWNRVLRIVPGLILLAVFTVLIIGPVTTSYHLVDYFTSGLTWSYFRIASVFGIIPHTPDLPGVFLTNPYKNAVNGSLWTLPVEFFMYVIICVAGILGMLPKRRLLLAVTTCLALLYCILNIKELHIVELIIGLIGHSSLVHSINDFSYLYLLYPVYFMIGSVYCLYSDAVKYSNKVALALFIFWILSFKTVLLFPMSLISLPYIVLCLANMRIPYVNMIGKYGDISYGLYIYAFLVQQTTIHFIGTISSGQLIVVSLIMTVVLASMSWKLVESRALELKNKDPRMIFDVLKSYVKIADR